MKSSLQKNLSFEKTIKIDEKRCIGFMGKEGMVYATPMMVSDVEYSCRDWLLAHLDPGEDSVGTQVVIDHLAPTPLGFSVRLKMNVVEVDRRKIVFAFSVADVEEVGRGTHTRFIVDGAKTKQRLAAKRAKAGGG